MEVEKYIVKICEKIKKFKDKGYIIGFVPTMGALHEGHLSLIRQSKKENDITIASIFVNPIQFNNKEDLRNYPRPLTIDLEMLRGESCDLVFLPDEKEIYPEPSNRSFNFEGLDSVMEGKHRPGHFNGVAIIVSRLFEIIKPDNAYFGEKDYQQLMIIKYMVAQIKLPINIISCAIIREFDGLAMSSRNTLLLPNDRKNAGIIRQMLLKAKEMSQNTSYIKIKEMIISEINKIPNFKVEYFEIADRTTLKVIDNESRIKEAIGFIAVYAGKVRLIDNIKI